MRIKDNFKVRKIADQNLIVNQGASHSDLTKIITLNETALLLWNKLLGHDFTDDDGADILVEEFGIDRETALADFRKWISTMTEAGVIEVR